MPGYVDCEDGKHDIPKKTYETPYRYLFLKPNNSKYSFWVLFVCLFVFLRRGLIVQLWLAWKLLHTPGWPLIYKNPPASASQVLGSAVCITLISSKCLEVNLGIREQSWNWLRLKKLLKLTNKVKRYIKYFVGTPVPLCTSFKIPSVLLPPVLHMPRKLWTKEWLPSTCSGT